MSETDIGVSRRNIAFRELVRVICKAASVAGNTRAQLVEEFQDAWLETYSLNKEMAQSARWKMAANIMDRAKELSGNS